MPHAPIPVPTSPRVLAPKLPAQSIVPTDPNIFRYHQGNLIPQYVVFSLVCQDGMVGSLGVYGPNPPVLDGPHGVSCIPKAGLPDVGMGSCKNHLQRGDYYVVVRSGDGPPTGHYSIEVHESLFP